MTIFICIIKTLVGYFVLMVVGTNLLGLVMRGIIPSYKKDADSTLTLMEDISSSKSIIMTIVFSTVGIAYFYALYHYWNIGIAGAGMIIMFTRLPDLLFEMKTGKKISSSNMPKRPIDVFCSILSWAAAPLIYYSLCYLT